MARSLKIFFLVVFFLAAGVIALFQTTRPLEYVLTKVLTHNISGLKINNLHIEDYSFQDRQAFLDQISIDFSIKGADYLLHSDQVVVGSWRALLGNLSNDFIVKGVHLVSKDIKFSNASARITYEPGSKKDWKAEGRTVIPHASYSKQGIEEVVFNFSARPQTITFKEVQAKALKGQINGEFMLEYKPDLPYSMDIIFSGIDTTALPAQANISQQFKGVIDGSLRVTGDLKHMENVEARVNAPHGAYASADFLRLFTFFTKMTGDPYTKIVEVAINRKKEHFLEALSLEVNNVGKEKLSSSVNFKSKSSNLDFNATYDINLGTELAGLFQSGRHLLDFYKQYFEKK